MSISSNDIFNLTFIFFYLGASVFFMANIVIVFVTKITFGKAFKNWRYLLLFLLQFFYPLAVYGVFNIFVPKSDPEFFTFSFIKYFSITGFLGVVFLIAQLVYFFKKLRYKHKRDLGILMFEVDSEKQKESYLHIGITSKEKEVLKELADRKDVTISDLVRIALNDYIKKQKQGN